MGFPIDARFAHPDAGWKSDQEHAAEHLTVGQVYTVRTLDVGRSSSSLTLVEFPGETFNTVLFEPVSYDCEGREVTSVNDPQEAQQVADDQDQAAEASQDDQAEEVTAWAEETPDATPEHEPNPF